MVWRAVSVATFVFAMGMITVAVMYGLIVGTNHFYGPPSPDAKLFVGLWAMIISIAVAVPCARLLSRLISGIDGYKLVTEPLHRD